MKNTPRRNAVKWLSVIACLGVFGVVLFRYTARTDNSVAPANESAGSTAASIAEPNESATAAVALDPRAAQITVGGVVRTLVPNARGEFQRLIVPASATIKATIPFAEATPGENIPVEAEDGGLLQGAASQGNVTVNPEHSVTVDYQVSANDGMHRVTLRRGGESRVLEFWVGTEPAVLVRS